MYLLFFNLLPLGNNSNNWHLEIAYYVLGMAIKKSMLIDFNLQNYPMR